MSSENEMLNKIFEMVQEKRSEKPPRRKRAPMTPEQKERALENLRRGRETSKKNRMAAAAAKKGLKNETKEQPIGKPSPPEPQVPEPQVQVQVQVRPEPPSQVPEPRKPQVEKPQVPEPFPQVSEPQPVPAKKLEPIKEEPFTYSTYGGGGGSLW